MAHRIHKPPKSSIMRQNLLAICLWLFLADPTIGLRKVGTVLVHHQTMAIFKVVVIYGV